MRCIPVFIFDVFRQFVGIMCCYIGGWIGKSWPLGRILKLYLISYFIEYFSLSVTDLSDLLLSTVRPL